MPPRLIADLCDYFLHLVLVGYLAAFFTLVKSLRQHPYCNAECCLSVIMIMNDAAEDVTFYEHEEEDEQSENEG